MHVWTDGRTILPGLLGHLSGDDLTTVYRPFVRDYTVSRYQKGKTNLDLLDQETASGSGSAGPYANLHLAPGR